MACFCAQPVTCLKKGVIMLEKSGVQVQTEQRT